MEKRFILFFVLSFIVILLYPYILRNFGLIPKAPIEKILDQAEVEDTGEPVEVKENKDPPKLTFDSPSPVAEELITVETDLYRIVISTRGGTITEWKLNQYFNQTETGDEAISLYTQHMGNTAPLSLKTSNEMMDQRVNDAVYQLEGGNLRLSTNKPTGSITLVLNDATEEIYIAKTMSFSNDGYIIDVGIDARGLKGPYLVYGGTNFGLVNWGGGERGFIGFIGPTTMIAGEIIKNKPDKFEGTLRHDKKASWAALQDKYFIGAMIPAENTTSVSNKEGEKQVMVGLEFPDGGLSKFRFYGGPKEFNRLSDLGVRLDESIDFGWFMFGSWSIVRAIAKPLFQFLRFLYDFTHNYGASIIILTVVVRSLFIPLMHKSYKAMKAMKILQPEMAKLQKKFKDDKERLNKEMMELYKKHGANPLSGCLPMFLQIPVFVALFNVLNTTIELRQAPFCCWIADLSTKDPYYVLPIVMGASMMVQQKLQPTTMDPRQAKIFLFMPAFFTVMFLNFPSGLVLYWLTNNLLTILQQYITINYIDKKTETPPEIEKKSKK